MNVSHTLHLMSSKCHGFFLVVFVLRKCNIEACQDCTNRATPKYADGERKALNTYTNCKLKMERYKEGKDTENKGGDSQDYRRKSNSCLGLSMRTTWSQNKALKHKAPFSQITALYQIKLPEQNT